MRRAFHSSSSSCPFYILILLFLYAQYYVYEHAPELRIDRDRKAATTTTPPADRSFVSLYALSSVDWGWMDVVVVVVFVVGGGVTPKLIAVRVCMDSI